MMMMNNAALVAICAATVAVLGGVTAFSNQNHGARTSAINTRHQLMMSSSCQSSRRDVLSNTATIAAVGLSTLILGADDAMASFKPGPPTAQSAANKAAESYQGVYSDPNHPEGYRVIMASGKGATMTLSDGVAKDAPEGTEEKTYKDIHVTLKEDGNQLLFDFSFKGGPKGVIATLSNDKQSLTFPDGNTWKKNANLYDGIYKDPQYPNGYRIIRKFKSTKTITEVNNRQSKDSKFIMGKHASLFGIPTAAFTFFNYTGKETCTERACRSCEVVCKDEIVGQFSLQESNTVFPYGTITFPDKTVWTRI